MTPEVNDAINTFHREISYGHNTPRGARVLPASVTRKVYDIIEGIRLPENNSIFRHWLWAHGWGLYASKSGTSLSAPEPAWRVR